MSKRERRSFLLLNVLGVLVAFSTTSAQPAVETARGSHQNACRLAARVLTTGEPYTRREWALRSVSGCSDQGPAILAAEWSRINASGRDLDLLTVSSMYVRDQRIYDQMLAVAASPERPVVVRTAAMEVLVKYVVPSSSFRPWQLVPPDSIKYIPIAAGSTTRNVQRIGSQPVSGDIGPEVLALLERLGGDRTGQPRGVWYAAASLGKRVRWELEHPETP